MAGTNSSVFLPMTLMGKAQGYSISDSLRGVQVLGEAWFMVGIFAQIGADGVNPK